MTGMKHTSTAILLGCVCLTISCATIQRTPTFTKTKLESQFISEGAEVGDFNRDGNKDIVAGWMWFEGPGFAKRHEFNAPPAKPFDGEKSYSDYFLTYVYDFNNDKWDDILVYSWPGKEAALSSCEMAMNFHGWSGCVQSASKKPNRPPVWQMSSGFPSPFMSPSVGDSLSAAGTMLCFTQ